MGEHQIRLLQAFQDEKQEKADCLSGNGCENVQEGGELFLGKQGFTCVQGGYIAEVSTKMEMANLQSVFKYKIIPVWLGAVREAGGEFRWASGERFVAEQIDGEEDEGANCLVRKAQRMVAKLCSSKQFVLCEIASHKSE